MKKTGLVSLTLLFFITVFYPKASFALSCANLPPIEIAYEKYDGVMIGQVEEIVSKSGSNELKVQVLTSFKGIEENKLLVEENVTWGSWYGPSTEGETYLFFLKKTEAGWENPLCSPTEKFTAGLDVDPFLQKKEIPLKKLVSSATESKQIVKKDVGLRELSTPIHWTTIAIPLWLIGMLLIVLLFIRYKKKVNGIPAASAAFFYPLKKITRIIGSKSQSILEKRSVNSTGRKVRSMATSRPRR